MAKLTCEDLELSPLLVGLHREELAFLTQLAAVRTYRAGEAVVVEGTPGDTMFLLCEGEVAVEKTAASGESVELAVLSQPGDFFGEMVFVDVMPRSATVRARGPSVLLAFHLDALQKFFEAYREARLVITLNIARMLSKRLRKADETIAALKSREG